MVIRKKMLARRKKAQKIKLFTKKNLAFKMLKGLILAQKIIELTVFLSHQRNFIRNYKMVFRTHTIDVIILCMRINIFKHRNKSLDACIYAYKCMCTWLEALIFLFI